MVATISEAKRINRLRYRCVGIVLVAAMTQFPFAAHADAGVQFARNKQCLACHQVDTQRVGPSFKAIAERYVGVPDVQQYLAHTIRHGSRGKWGAIPMPAQAQVNTMDAARLAAWILTLKPDSTSD